MADKTGIEWTEATWNPVTGCDKVSPGCDHCYAETIAHRFDGTPQYPNGFQVTLRPERLDIPLHWRRPRRIFVNSMSDLFHDQVPDEYIAHAFAVMQSCAAHTFQILTKRHARMRSLLNSIEFWSAVTDFGHILISQRPSRQQFWPDHGQQHRFLPNVWLGVSTENQQWADIRIPALLDTPAAIRFISAEPLLGPIDLIGQLCETCEANMEAPQCNACYGRWWIRPRRDNRIDWVIAGGESGREARPMHPDWARSLRDQCQAAGVPFLFKQWGEWTPNADGQPYRDWWNLNDPHAFVMRYGKKRAGRELDGRTWDQYPQAVSHG